VTALAELHLGVGELVRNRVGNTFWKQRCGVEFEQALFHHPAHQVGDLWTPSRKRPSKRSPSRGAWTATDVLFLRAIVA
jgi:hypothetical protein